MSDEANPPPAPDPETRHPDAWHIIEEPASGERQMVRDPENYPDWAVVAADFDRYPEEYEQLEDGAIVPDLVRLEADLLKAIDEAAGAFRCRFITDQPGQEMTYMAKEVEARAILAGGDSADAPMITGGAKARGIEVEKMAGMVVARADAWRVIGSAVEIRRESAKAAVAAATTAEEKRAAAAVDWDRLITVEKGTADG
ncbi:MAG TPA: hypothetical protein VE053_06675 [Allosphingosinicella sp.]|nr:hypothetical protein [Allosphingosinicella sp.]